MKKIALSDNDKELILHWLKGGMYLGGGLGALNILGNQLTQKTQELTGNDSVLDNGLTLVMRPKKDDKNAVKKYAATWDGQHTPKPVKHYDTNSWESLIPTIVKNSSVKDQESSIFRSPAALLGGAGAAVASYAGVTALYQWLKKKQMEKELEDAQTSYIDDLSEHGTKLANSRKGMDIKELVGAVPLSVIALTALASGVLANKGLQKYFPDRKSAIRMNPAKVVLKVEDDPSTPGDEESETIINPKTLKNARALFYESVALVQPVNTETDFDNVIKAAAAGHINSMRDTTFNYGVEVMLAGISGNSGLQPTTEAIKLAALALAEDAILAPSVDLLAALEYHERAPMLCKIAAGIPEDKQDELITLIGQFNIERCSSEFDNAFDFTSPHDMLDKNASVPESLLNLYLQLA